MVSTYTQVCPVLFGEGAVKQIGDKVKELKGSKAMCIFDQGVKASGIADIIADMLRNEKIDTVMFDGVLPDAPKDMIESAGQIARDNDVDTVIGIGGGSSLDTAKAVAILADNPKTIDSYYANKEEYISRSPLILIPTSSGTGSEVTVMGVIYDKDTDAKEFVLKHADLAILDPELTVSVPPQVTAATGMDAMSHAVEAYTSNCGNPKSDILALEAIQLIADNIETAYNDGNNMEARKNLCLASNYAGMAFSDSSVHFGHAAGHEFGIRFDMPHGIACAIALPEVITFSAETIPEKTKNIARALGIDIPDDATGAEAGEWAAERVRNMMKKIGIKSLKEQGLSRDAVISCAPGAIEKNWFVICAVKPVDNSVMAKEMGKMYDNYQ